MAVKDEMVKQFAKDFDMQMENYKFNPKTLVITFHCVDVSSSEINRWIWQVPAFIVRKHCEVFAPAIEAL